MNERRILRMNQPVTSLPRGKDRDRRMSQGASRTQPAEPAASREAQDRRRLTSPRGGGRAWINGREVGGTDPRYAHLSCGSD